MGMPMSVVTMMPMKIAPLTFQAISAAGDEQADHKQKNASISRETAPVSASVTVRPRLGTAPD